jgi:DNA-binding CsgD family transcriptional regulator
VSVELIGREADLAAALSAVRSTSGAVVTGVAGVGKTALAGAVAERVRSDGDRVLWTVATEASSRMPFGALGVLIPDDVSSFHPALAVGQIRRRLASMGGRRPALVVVDDAHLLDDQSAVTLLGLASTGAARALVTVRAGERVPDAVTALWKDGFLSPLQLAALDRAATRSFVARCVGGEVAESTAELLWQVTQGNPLYLSELVHFGRTDGRLVDVGGLWLWRGELGVPPRLADLLEHRFDGLSPVGVDALCALAMAQPLSLGTLAAVVPHEAMDEIEQSGLVAAEERDGTVWLRVVHPLLTAAAGRLLTPMRRRRLADALAVASRAEGSPPSEAAWMLDASQVPPVGDLLAAAEGVLLHNPSLAARFAERALSADPGPAAALALAEAHAELGRTEAAWSAHREAVARAHSDADKVRVALGEAWLTTWMDRRPADALDRLHAVRSALLDPATDDGRPGSAPPLPAAPAAPSAPVLGDRPASDSTSSSPTAPGSLAGGERAGLVLEIEAAIALITLFSGRPAEALDLAEAVLSATDPAPGQSARVRAATARAGATSMVGRRNLAVLDELLALTGEPGVAAYDRGLAHSMVVLNHLLDVHAPVPGTYPGSGRWPVLAVQGRNLEPGLMPWPLAVGARRIFEGNLVVGVAHLREGLAHQRVGQGLYRSEAVAMLGVGLAALGEVDEAEQLLEEEPPDEVALYPGLLPWLKAAIAGARGRPEAADLCFEAADAAWAAGGLVSTVAYLNLAARYGAAEQAAARLDALGGDRSADPPVTVARAASIRARANGDGMILLMAAEHNAACGIDVEAVELAQLAGAALSRDTTGARARAALVADEARQRLQIDVPGFEPVVGLTRRELETARLAARGQTDKAIADTLVLSVRTVESHLASAYRKLGISSRRQLSDILADLT